MKIIIDSYIPYIQGVLDLVADVEYLPHTEITAETVRCADALIIRTRTQCDEKLLKGSKVKFIASATIGYDHIDAEYCRKNNIVWTNAPGCNALSVVQYMASALSFLAKKNNFDIAQKTIGIVGVGAVGSKIAELAAGFGMRVLLNDPPRARREGNEKFVSLAQICEQADIISFHTPLNVSGEDCTLHLASEDFFNALKKKPIIVNTARGEIMDTKAVLQAKKMEKISDLVIDCWEKEPTVDCELLHKTTLATPHIAGYSADGKANTSAYAVRAVSKFFSLGLNDWQVPELFLNLTGFKNLLDLSDINRAADFFLATYPIETDSKNLQLAPENFENQRSHYPFRREPKAYFEMLNKDFSENFVKKFGVFA